VYKIKTEETSKQELQQKTRQSGTPGKKMEKLIATR
jgi:hypothetical protein